jgi:hypothetical protein
LVSAFLLETDDPRWRDILGRTRHDVYHLPEYVAIEARRQQYSGGALAVGDRDRQLLIPVLFRRDPITSGGAESEAVDVLSPYGYPGVIVSDAAKGDRDFIKTALVLAIERLGAEGVCAAFLRQHPVLSPSFDDLDLPGMTLRRVPTVAVSLQATESEIWARTRKGHQSTINRCTRLGHVARIGTWQEHGAAFREIYRETMDQASAAGHYYFDDAYFDALQALGNHVHLCIVEAAGDIAAACLLFECHGVVHAHLGGTRERYRSQSPFSLLLHFARLWARERGNHVLHLGGGVGGADDPVFKFKEGFSRDRLDYVTVQLVIDQARYKSLVHARSASLGVPVENLLASGFFPAYRAGGGV